MFVDPHCDCINPDLKGLRGEACRFQSPKRRGRATTAEANGTPTLRSSNIHAERSLGVVGVPSGTGLFLVETGPFWPNKVASGRTDPCSLGYKPLMGGLLLAVEDCSSGGPQDHRAETREQDHLHTLNSAPVADLGGVSGRCSPSGSAISATLENSEAG